MAISYKKLWKLLIDRDMKKKDLVAISGISQSSVTKMSKNENVRSDCFHCIFNRLRCGWIAVRINVKNTVCIDF